MFWSLTVTGATNRLSDGIVYRRAVSAESFKTPTPRHRSTLRRRSKRSNGFPRNDWEERDLDRLPPKLRLHRLPDSVHFLIVERDGA